MPNLAPVSVLYVGLGWNLETLMVGLTMDKQHNQDTISTTNLAKWLHTYAMTSLICGIIVGIVSFSYMHSLIMFDFKFDRIGLEWYLTNVSASLRTDYMLDIVCNGMLLVVLFMVAAEFKKLARTSPIARQELNLVYKLLMVSFIFHIINLMVTYSNKQEMFQLLEHTDFTGVSTTQLEWLQNQVEKIQLRLELVRLVPLTLEFIVYYKFYTWAKFVTLQYSFHGTSKDPRETTLKIVIGNVLILGGSLLNLIPRVNWGAWPSLIGLIIFLLGYFQTATVFGQKCYERPPLK